MADFSIYITGDANDPPKLLTRRTGDSSYYHFLPVPLPEHLVVFGLGEWPKNVDATGGDMVISYKDDMVLIGTISDQNRTICWEKRNCKLPDSLSSADEKGMAKLCIELKSAEPPQVSECQADKNPKEEKIKTGKKPGPNVSKEENETTPKVGTVTKKGAPAKTEKQKKRRSSTSKTDKTPTGPTPKKQKTNTRVRKMKLNEETAEAENKSADDSDVQEKENKEKVTSPAPVKLHHHHVTLGTPVLSICKDVTNRAPHPSSRWGHSLCMVHNNTAVLIGGQGERQQLSRDSVWTLDPVTRKWKCPEMKTEQQKAEYRMGHTTTYDPKLRCIYVYGGSKNLKWFHDVHMLDVDEWKWMLLKVAGKAPTRAYHSATLYRNELWIFGGVYPRPDPQPDGCSNDIHIFSPVMENWYQPIVKGEKPLPRSGHSATLIDDQLVIFGGWDAPICYNDLHILDMCFVEWSQPKVNGTPPLPRSWHASCALANSRILIHGGYDGNLALDDTHIFNLATLSWIRIKLEPTPIPRAGHQALCLPYYHENQEQDEVLIFGGGDNDGAFFHDLISASIPFNPVLDHSILPSSTTVLTNVDSNMQTV